MASEEKVQSPIIFFDGVCNFCNSSVNFIIRYDKKKLFKFASLQSDIAKKLITDIEINQEKPDSIILLQNNKTYQKSTAALKIAQKLRFPLSTLIIFIAVPKFIRDFVYNIIAKNRYKWFGKKSECMIPSPDLKERFL